MHPNEGSYILYEYRVVAVLEKGEGDVFVLLLCDVFSEDDEEDEW